MSLEKCPNEILFMVASHLKPEDMSSFLQANRRLANLLTPDFAKILSARSYPNRDKRLRRQYKTKRRMAAGWARRRREECGGGDSRLCVRGGRRRGEACSGVPEGGREPSMSSSSTMLLPDIENENEALPAVSGAQSGDSRPVNRGVYASVNKPLPKLS
ncbi:hypothetical protein HOY80DRAFT_1038226 [Tuber brumale]|nr:hypothetical protein HOY80DRAFT_1038226 [Tuber brumale]